MDRARGESASCSAGVCGATLFRGGTALLCPQLGNQQALAPRGFCMSFSVCGEKLPLVRRNRQIVIIREAQLDIRPFELLG
jgi:hypothetical protein